MAREMTWVPWHGDGSPRRLCRRGRWRTARMRGGDRRRPAATVLHRVVRERGRPSDPHAFKRPNELTSGGTISCIDSEPVNKGDRPTWRILAERLWTSPQVRVIGLHGRRSVQRSTTGVKSCARSIRRAG